MPLRFVVIALRTDLFWGVALTRPSSVTFASPGLRPKFPPESETVDQTSLLCLERSKTKNLVLNLRVED